MFRLPTARLPLTLLLTALWAASAPAPADELPRLWSAEQLLGSSWQSHPLINSKRAGVNAAESDLEGVKWQRYPTPSIEANRRFNGTSYHLVRLEQPLWTGGRITAGIDAAGSRKEAAEAGVSEAQVDLGLKVIAAWAEARRQQAKLDHARNGVKEHEKLLNLISRRVDQEVSPLVDRDFARSRLLQASNDLSSINQALNNALTSLSQYASQPVSRVNSAFRNEVPSSREAALGLAMDFSPLIRRLSAEEEAAGADIDTRRAAMLPQLSLRLESVTGSQGDNRAMVVVTAQLGAGLSAPAAVDAATARRESARLTKEAAARDIREQITLDWEDLQATRSRLENARLSRTMSADVFESYTRQYTTGRKTWIDVLNAIREKTQADFSLADAEAQEAAATLRLRLRTGLLRQDSATSAP
ncbi:MAG: hypothetical protein RIR00_1211 [Pseudomonadota bacterium]